MSALACKGAVAHFLTAGRQSISFSIRASRAILGAIGMGVHSVREHQVVSKTHAPQAPPEPSPMVEDAEYIAAMCESLSSLAARADLPTLAYFLNLARLEAKLAAHE
jgi:hypothetical protein